ncbi:MAG TPA: hypothetical protein VII99_17460, partial [Bacteroidia bacterium]
MKIHFFTRVSLLFFTLIAAQFSFAGEDGGKKSSAKTSSPSPVVAPSDALADQGNKLLSKGQFSAAKLVWDEVLRQNPNDANANFKMGMCYYNSLDESPRALPFLRKAAKNMSPKYDFFRTSDSISTAPIDVLYFLGETYLAADQPDSALWMFFQY